MACRWSTPTRSPMTEEHALRGNLTPLRILDHRLGCIFAKSSNSRSSRLLIWQRGGHLAMGLGNLTGDGS